MGSLSTFLAYAELVGSLVIGSLLVVSLAWKRHLVTFALGAAIVFGLVFANPFGVVARASDTPYRSLSPTTTADESRHWIRLAGVPVAWFTPYDQPYPWAGLYENSPNSELKLRYGFSFLPSTGASSVVAQCGGSIDTPCWGAKRGDDYPLVHREADGRPYVVPRTTTIVPNRQGESGYLDVPNVYDVTLGITSWRAFAYWAVVGIALAVGVALSRVRWRPIALAAGFTLLAGLVVGGVLAVVPAPARGAVTLVRELLPEPVDPPPVTGEARPTAIDSSDGGRVDKLTASEAVDGLLLAIWTAESDGLMHLRTRRLSAAGEPLDLESTTIRSWSQTTSPGQRNCEVPAELQAVRLAGGEILVAWSSACDLSGGTGGPATITGAVLSPSGGLVREPFLVLGYDRGSTAHASPRYWLRATTDGQPVLFWEAPTRTAYFGRSLFVSALTTDLQAVDATELMTDEHGIGAIAVACGRACLVAQGRSGAIGLRIVGVGGRVLRREVVASNPKALRSELAAAVQGETYIAGWLESDGANADGYLASIAAHGEPGVEKVASRIPAGDGRQGVTPDPLGIVVTGPRPALVFQTATDVDDEFLLHTAGRSSVETRAIEVRLGAPTVLRDVLVAIAGLWPDTPAEPATVRFRGGD